MSLDWGYSKTDGPATWADKFPQAAGSRQSPVDINTSQVSSDTLQKSGSKPLDWTYAPGSAQKIINTGYGWKVETNQEGCELVGGPLEDTHHLAQFHCHWARTSAKGSEHTVDGQAFAAELHLVHWNSGKYATIGEAASQPDGLAVLGVLMKVGAAHPEVEKIARLIPQVHFREQQVSVEEDIDISKFIPESRRYWTYLGSLTTPPCSESVTWIVFKDAIEVSEEQLEMFRSLRYYKHGEEPPCDCTRNGLIAKNYRPPLPLGNRELRECGFA